MNTEITPFKSFEFEGHGLAFITFKGRGCVLAAQLGEAAGYKEGRILVKQISGAWAGEFKDGYHYEILKGEELQQLRECLFSAAGSPDPSTFKVPGSLDAKATHAMVLYEPGVYLATLLTKKPAGKRLRAKLAQDILPEIARTGSYSGLGSQEVQELRAENERLRAQLKLLPQADQEEIVDPGPLARYGISIGKGMTTPTNPYKRPAPVWRVRAPWNDRLTEAFKRCRGRWYRAGKCWAFYEDPRRLLMR